MEWNRGDQQPAAPSPAAHRRSSKLAFMRGLRVATVALLFAITGLLVALACFIVFGGDKGESKYINDKQLQAVFLNGGQVYFGHIDTLNDKYLQVSNIYYLRVDQAVQPDPKAGQTPQNNISLVKLGCELHGPQDKMLINREQVIFWENLKDDGQVAKAVAEYTKQNPNGQKCDTPADNTKKQ